MYVEWKFCVPLCCSMVANRIWCCSDDRCGKSMRSRVPSQVLLLAVVRNNGQENQQTLLADKSTPDFECEHA